MSNKYEINGEATMRTIKPCWSENKIAIVMCGFDLIMYMKVDVVTFFGYHIKTIQQPELDHSKT